MLNDTVYYTVVKKTNINETKEARLILEKLLNKLNIEIPEILVSNTGKPYFKNSNIYFNYSHSKTYIAVCISYNEVGIDIEDRNRLISSSISKKYLNNELDNNKRLVLWVKKESYSKLKGLGLLINFNNIDINNIKENNYLINNKNYICSIYSNSSKFKKINV